MAYSVTRRIYPRSPSGLEVRSLCVLAQVSMASCLSGWSANVIAVDDSAATFYQTGGRSFVCCWVVWGWPKWAG